jgi:hypothetical protein
MRGTASNAPSTTSRPACPSTWTSTYWDTSWSQAKGAIQTTNIYDKDKTVIAIGNGELLSPEPFKTMTDTRTRGQGGPIPGCPQLSSRERRAHLRYGRGDQGQLAAPRPVVQRMVVTEEPVGEGRPPPRSASTMSDGAIEAPSSRTTPVSLCSAARVKAASSHRLP